MNVKDHIRGYSQIVRIKHGLVWYQTEDTKFNFPVPISDLGDAELGVREKSMLMMRYIRKFIETL